MPNDTVRKRRQSRISDAKPPEAWVDREVADCEFKDERLGKRFRSLLEQLSSSPGDGSPLVCQDWANTAYRFLDNGRDTGVSLYGPEQFITQLEHKLAAYTWNLIENYETEFVVVAHEIDSRGCIQRAQFRSTSRFQRETLPGA
jgi:hypothetical protein